LSDRPDPRERPPDPAGTRPKVDPDSLLPENADEPRLALGPGEGAELLPELRPAPAAVAPALPPDTEHTPRFQFLLGALLAVGAVALAAAVAIALRPDQVAAPQAGAWSPWQPSASTPLSDIITHVAREYRLPNNRELVAVQPAPLTLKGAPAQIALQQPLSQGGDISLLQGTPIVYQFCGLGRNCRLPPPPSVGRATLLRREALELALYTFRYIGPVDQVVVLLPPTIDQLTRQTEHDILLFERSDLAPLLVRPLYATLAHRRRWVAGAESSPHAGVVRRLTAIYASRATHGASNPCSAPPLRVLNPKLAEPVQSTTSTPPKQGGSTTPLPDLAPLLKSK